MAGQARVRPVRILSRLAAFSIVTGVAGAAAAAPGEAAPREAANDVERYLSALVLGIQKTKLDSGLEVVLNAERGAPSVSVSVTFPAGRDHGAAMPELFGSARHRRALDDTPDYELVRARGALSYQSAGWEHTTFTQVLPPDELPFALWLEGRRLRRWLHLSRPAISEFLPSFPFVAPERRTLFSLEQLAWAPAAELALNQWYACCYTPHGAVLTITGDFENDEALRLLAEHVGSWESDVREPERPRGQRAPHEIDALLSFDFERVASGSPLPELALGFVVPGAGDASHAAVTLAAELIERADGAAPGGVFDSRATHKRVELSEARGRSLLAIQVSRRAPSRRALTPEAAFNELGRLARRPPSEPALATLRKAVLLRWLDQLASPKQRSEVLGRYEVLHGDARLAARYASALAGVRASDVQRVLALLTADQAVVLHPTQQHPTQQKVER